MQNVYKYNRQTPFSQTFLSCGTTALCFVTTIGRLGYLGCNFLSHTLLFTLIKSFFPRQIWDWWDTTDTWPETTWIGKKTSIWPWKIREKGRVVPLSTQILQKCSDYATYCRNWIDLKNFWKYFHQYRLSYILVQYRF